ncbi:MAG TPA: glycoside hydrolase family 18 protein [Methylomirabilota bacterium]|nr:glycoside hydrolase family 18 protein [Methylomirabilota bacterium]
MKNLRVTRILIASVVCLLCFATIAGSAPAQQVATAAQQKRLIADYGYWSRTQTPPYSADQIPFSKLTHINHAGVNFDAKGNLDVPSGFLERKLIDKGHANGVKVMLLIGGDFNGLETTSGGLANLLKNLKTFIREYNYDGVDIDWEYPATTADATLFRSMLLGLRSFLPSPQYVISADVAPWGGDGYDFPDTKGLVDYFNVMTYDCAGPWTDSGQLNSPIFLDPNNPEQYNCDPGGSIKDAIDLFVKDLGISKAKLNMGTPFYGYFYHDVNALWGFCANEDCSDSVDYLNYGTDFKPLINKQGWRTYYDPYALVPYMLREDGSPGFITYDDAFSTFYRVWYTDWQRGLGGTFIWELDADYDGHSQDLLDAAFNATQPQTK